MKFCLNPEIQRKYCEIFIENIHLNKIILTIGQYFYIYDDAGTDTSYSRIDNMINI